MINNVCKQIIVKFSVNKFIETGVFMGDTMMIVQDWFCELYGDEFNSLQQENKSSRYRMYEIEINKKYFDDFVVPRYQHHINVEAANEDSVLWLNRKIEENEFTKDDSCLFYLDAHSHGSPNPEPMRDEISAILKLNNKPIISIDDWHVPTKRYDIYHLDQIKDLIQDRTDMVCYTKIHNFHRKWSILIFIDRYEEELDRILLGLPLLKEKI